VSIDKEMARLEESLGRRFRVVDTSVRIGDRDLSILHPASAEDLIDERDFERDERLPYWAELWPSAKILAEHVAGLRGEGRILLELGCGAGLVTTSAALAGFRVTASDYYEDAHRFARVNAWRNGAGEVTGLMLDWRDLPPDLPTYDVVFASDVLYERPYGEIVARVVGATLSPNGVALVTDPGRVGREGFLAALPENGLTVQTRMDLPFAEAGIRQTITLFEIVRTD
jgi:predicted nicotinamide N-methyase